MIIRVVENNVNVGLNCTENVYNVRLTNLGNAGLSAYQIAVANGFIGTEQDWLDSLDGSFTPSDYDLNEFTNESLDPFVRESKFSNIGCLTPNCIIQLPTFDNEELASSLANFTPYKTSTGELRYKLPTVVPPSGNWVDTSIWIDTNNWID